jgi:hypothetical protein
MKLFSKKSDARIDALRKTVEQHKIERRWANSFWGRIEQNKKALEKAWSDFRLNPSDALADKILALDTERVAAGDALNNLSLLASQKCSETQLPQIRAAVLAALQAVVERLESEHDAIVKHDQQRAADLELTENDVRSPVRDKIQSEIKAAQRNIAQIDAMDINRLSQITVEILS